MNETVQNENMLIGTLPSGKSVVGRLGTVIGRDGKDGKSAYEIAVDNGFEGTEAEWLDSLKASSEINPARVIFVEDVYTTHSFGNVKVENGEMTKLLDKGANMKDFLDLLVTVMYPEATEPSVSITFPVGKAHEVGTKVVPGYAVSFNSGSYTYGPETGVKADSWKITDTAGLESNEISGNFPELTVGDDTNYSVTAEATHGEGAVPLTNTKVEYPEGKIAAGTKTATSAAITGYRNSFYGTVTNKNEITSSIIRGLTKSGKALKNGSSFTVDVPVGAMRVIIAYPATLRDVSSIKDVNGLNAEIASGFTKTTVSVEGANGYTAKSYKVYYMDFAKANDKANKFTVTI